jgi:hypothetical protein
MAPIKNASAVTAPMRSAREAFRHSSMGLDLHGGLMQEIWRGRGSLAARFVHR